MSHAKPKHNLELIFIKAWKTLAVCCFFSPFLLPPLLPSSINFHLHWAASQFSTKLEAEVWDADIHIL